MQYYKINNSKYILVHKLCRTVDFFEKSLDYNVSYREKFDTFFFIGKKSKHFTMLKYENIVDKCVLLEDENEIFFLSPVVDLLHS